MRLKIIAMLLMCMVAFGSFPHVAAAEATASDSDGVRVPVIMYHSITDKNKNRWVITPAALDADLKYLAENGYTSVFISDVIDYVNGEGALPKKPVVLTFDDGMYDNLSVALPILEKYDMRIVLSIIGEPTAQYSAEKMAGARYGHLSWDEIRQMLDSGRVELANHTWGLHKNDNGRCGCMRKKSEDLDEYQKLLRTDISRLQQAICENLGITPVIFTYPFGAKCKEALEVLKEMGFLVTLSCHGGTNIIIPGDSEVLFDLKRNNRDPNKSAQYLLEQFIPNL